ncbi:MAG: nodulation protein NodZ [Phormidesmis sp.]
MSKYLLMKGAAGLGNRVFALVTAILYARLSDRTLAVDWRDNQYSQDGENVFFDLFDLIDIPHARQISSIDSLYSASVYPALWQGRLEKSVWEVFKEDLSQQGIKKAGKLATTLGQDIFKKYAYSVKKLDYAEDIVIAASYIEEINRMRPFFVGDYTHFRRAHKRVIFREIFHTHLALAPAIQRRFDDFKKIHFQGTQVIGIHIRKSDKAISYLRYKQALARQVERCPDACIFLATDNRDVEQELSTLYPRVVTLDKWLPKPGIKAHGNKDCPDLAEHAVTALLDIVLLASCDYLIYSRATSFGLLASYITPIPAANQVDIRTSLGEKLSKVKAKTQDMNRYFSGLLKLKAKT